MMIWWTKETDEKSIWKKGGKEGEVQKTHSKEQWKGLAYERNYARIYQLKLIVITQVLE
jgi:hypothetical protein